jgi:hypothetical protein
MSQENVEIVREAHERFTKTGQPIWERIDADTSSITTSQTPGTLIEAWTGSPTGSRILPWLGTATEWRSSV